MKGQQTLFSSNSSEWETPQALFDKLNDEFDFTLDPCSSHANHKCDKYFTAHEDGLRQSWEGERVWCNPPYGRDLQAWIAKGYNEATRIGGAKVVVMLLPARTDTRWFHKYIYKRSEIRFIKGRVKFGGGTTDAPFPSMVVVMRSASE